MSERAPSPKREPEDRWSTGRLSDQVFAWLTDQIVNGGLRPGQWVSENEIAETLGVSRSPVHQALQVLAMDGLVQVIPRRGTVIADLDVRDADDLYRARALVDGEMVKLCTETMADAHLEPLRQIVREMKDATGEHSAYYGCTLRFWRTLQELCPNQAIADLSWLLWRRSIRFRGILLRLPGQEEVVQQKLEELVELISTRDAETAGQKMEELLRDHIGAVLRRQEAFAGDGETRLRSLPAL